MVSPQHGRNKPLCAMYYYFIFKTSGLNLWQKEAYRALGIPTNLPFLPYLRNDLPSYWSPIPPNMQDDLQAIIGKGSFCTKFPGMSINTWIKIIRWDLSAIKTTIFLAIPKGGGDKNSFSLWQHPQIPSPFYFSSYLG